MPIFYEQPPKGTSKGKGEERASWKRNDRARRFGIPVRRFLAVLDQHEQAATEEQKQLLDALRTEINNKQGEWPVRITGRRSALRCKKGSLSGKKR